MPRDRPRKSNTGFILALVFGGIGLLAVLAIGGCVGLYWLGGKQAQQREKEETRETAQLPTRDEFRAKWLNKSQDEVLASFGKPESTSDTQGSPVVTWHYGKMFGDQKYARDPVTGKPDKFVRFEFGRADGRVTAIEF